MDRRRVVMLCGLGLFLLAGIFPPWNDGSYHFISFSGRVVSPGGMYESWVYIDKYRLYIEWGMIAVATAVMFWVVSPNTNTSVAERREKTRELPRAEKEKFGEDLPSDMGALRKRFQKQFGIVQEEHDKACEKVCKPDRDSI